MILASILPNFGLLSSLFLSNFEFSLAAKVQSSVPLDGGCSTTKSTTDSVTVATLPDRRPRQGTRHLSLERNRGRDHHSDSDSEYKSPRFQEWYSSAKFGNKPESEIADSVTDDVIGNDDGTQVPDMARKTNRNSRERNINRHRHRDDDLIQNFDSESSQRVTTVVSRTPSSKSKFNSENNSRDNDWSSSAAYYWEGYSSVDESNDPFDWLPREAESAKTDFPVRRKQSDSSDSMLDSTRDSEGDGDASESSSVTSQTSESETELPALLTTPTKKKDGTKLMFGGDNNHSSSTNFLSAAARIAEYKEGSAIKFESKRAMGLAPNSEKRKGAKIIKLTKTGRRKSAGGA